MNTGTTGGIRAIVSRIKYKGDNGSCIASVKEAGKFGTRQFDVLGTMDLDEGLTYHFEGTWAHHPKFGKQLKVKVYKNVAPTDADGITAYLASGVFPQIGVRRAHDIVAKFGEKSLEIIEHQPQRLKEIPGLTDDRIQQISECYIKNKDRQDIFTELYAYGLTPWQASKLVERYKEKTLQVLKTDTYAITELRGFSFNTADNIARRFGVSKGSIQRARAAVCHVLDVAATEGHTYLNMNMLQERLLDLEVPDNCIGQAVVDLTTDALFTYRGIGYADGGIHKVDLYSAEYLVAERLKQLYTTPLNHAGVTYDFSGYSLNERQQDIIRAAKLSRVLVVTGGPGTGKSHTLGALRGFWKEARLQVAYAAPTGKAAQRMAEMLDFAEKPSTIHRLLGYNPGDFSWTYNSFNPLPFDVVVIDEASMLDIDLAAALVDSIDPSRTQLVLMGDIDQLPSVGPGAVLKDIIDSGVVPVVRLTEIMRQDSASKIVTVAHQINRGEKFEVDNNADDLKVFFYDNKASQESMASGLIGLITNKLIPAGWDPISDIQVLTPMRSRGALSAQPVGDALQNLLNPSDGKPEMRLWGGEGSVVIRLGDKVIQTKNDYSLGVFNGEVGIVTDIDTGDKTKSISVDFGGDKSIVKYVSSEQWSMLRLAYALTVHKAQGSEFPVVVVPLHISQWNLLNRQLLYTAVTRARKLVVVVSTREALAKAIANNEQALRFTRLREMMKVKRG